MEFVTLSCGAYRENSYLAQGKNGSFLIDPGDEPCAFNDMRGISDILLTHGHFDHMLCAKTIRDNTGARIWIAKEDAEMLTGAFPNQYRADAAIQPFVPFEADCFYPEDGTIRVCGETFTVLKTPGHTRGSVCLLHENTLFSGDTLFAVGYGRTDMEGGSAKSLRDSLIMLLSMPGNPMVYPGHGDPSDMDTIREYFHFTKR